MSNGPGIQDLSGPFLAFSNATTTSNSYVFSAVENTGVPCNNIGISMTATVGAGVTSLLWKLQGTDDSNAQGPDPALLSAIKWYDYPYADTTNGAVTANEFIVTAYPLVVNYPIAQSGQLLGPFIFPMFHRFFRIGLKITGAGTASGIYVSINRMVV